jgi:hypothetical protein
VDDMPVDPNDRTKIFSTGKVNFIVFPEVYYKFVTTLFREHDDLVRGMVLAKVKLEDGSALDYLNLMLGTKVSRNTPMEIGYAALLDALNMRVHTIQTEKEAERVGRELFSEVDLGPKRDSSEIGKPLFPQWDDPDGHKQH